MKITNRILAILVGLVFIFSGLIKLNDPVGTQIKLEEYFEVFKTDNTIGLSALSAVWSFFESWALTLSVILSSAEIILGVNLAFFYRPKNTIWTLFVLVTFFGFLTFYSAYFNKVTDCGCFGEVIKLTPWQSFWKDMALFVMIAFLIVQSFVQKEQFKEKPNRLGFIFSTITVFVCLFISYYAIYHLPLVDFSVYRKGNNIQALMKPAEELKFGKEVFTYTNLKTGEDESFETWDAKYGDTTVYKYKSYEKPLLNPEAKPKITDYKITAPDGSDYTEETFKGKKLLLVVQEALKSNANSYGKINPLLDGLDKDISLVILNGDGNTIFKPFAKQLNLKSPYFFVDKTVLKTMIRSNPGLILLNEGTVIAKWHYNDLPDANTINQLLK